MSESDGKKAEHVESTVVTAIAEVAGAEGKRAYILFLAGPLVGKLHLLEDGVTVIGRSNDVTIPINDSRISRRHVQIRVENASGVLEDLGSTNGTFVNGCRVSTHALADGDKIQISSSTIFKFALQDQTENIFHKELYKMAVLDPVTNVHNKRFFLERFKEEFSHARRAKHPLGLILLDIDHFKQVNDTHGHLAGDMVLHQVAGRVKETVRQEDIVARYGGEEFAVIVRGATEEQTAALAERIRSVVAATPCQFEARTIPITVSGGVAALTPAHDFAEPNALIQATDDCLYSSKQHGRNRITTLSGKT
ncbi:MAG: diguanylate cyclase [Deltaproteobacteria bacterium]|nr:diguanylate cyclase [Deltaproteobacteria bacterium]